MSMIYTKSKTRSIIYVYLNSVLSINQKKTNTNWVLSIMKNILKQNEKKSYPSHSALRKSASKPSSSKNKFCNVLM